MYGNIYDQGAQDYSNKKNKKVPEDNYGAHQINYSQQENNSLPNYSDDKFKKTKNKIKVILFKNGFILNNGPFRDKSIPQNLKFMEEVEKGLIPHEIRKKGIDDLGILLENRKNEVYRMNPITEALGTYIHGNQNVNNNYNYNQNQNLNYPFPNNININQNKGEIKINPPIILDPGQEIPLNFQKPFIINQNNNYQNKNKYSNNNNNPTYVKRRSEASNMPLTPVGGRKNRNNIFIEKNEEKEKKEEDFGLKKRESLSAPKKKEETKFKTFASFMREEKIKEEEEKKKKKGKKQNNQEENEDKKEEEKKFQAFQGTGQIIGNVNTQGLHVNKNVKNVVNNYSPISTFNVRLFNGEIVKCEFNHTQTLRDLYYYIQNISGSRNFHLLDGFPPKPLREYNKPIGELHLDNTMLTQKIKES